jgi:hypothetical protein
VKVTDDDGFTGVDTVTVRVGQVMGRYAFYNRSGFDGNDANANQFDDHAIAADKRALLPGETPGFSNVTSYTRGLNGLMLDLPVGSLRGTDFEFLVGPRGGTLGAPGADAWSLAPAPLAVITRSERGPGGSFRTEILWRDGAIFNQWLKVTVKAGARTGLAAPVVFYFGNLVGEVGDGRAMSVTPADMVSVRRAMRARSAGVTNVADFDRNGWVDARDLAVARGNLFTSLPLPTTGAAAAGARATDALRAAPAVFESLI